MAATVRGITLGRYSDSVDAKDDEVTLLDNKKIYLGTGSDLQLVHDGSNSIINDTGTGNLKVQVSGSDKLEVTSTGVDITGNLTVSGTSPGLTGVCTNNLIINGACLVAQRGTSSTSTGWQTVDRWHGYWSGTDENLTQAQVNVDAGTTPYELGFRKAYKITNGNQTGGAGAGDVCHFSTKLEAGNIATSGWDYTSTSNYVTLSFWVRSSVAQNFYVYLVTADGTSQNYPFETGTLSANTWTKVTKTIPGNANLTFDNDVNKGLDIYFSLYRGTDTTGSLSLDAWAAFNTNLRHPNSTSTWYTTDDATFEVTGAQLELGQTANDYKHELSSETLAKCQRYYWELDCVIMSHNYNAATKIVQIWHPVEMRTVPTETITVGNGSFTSYQETTKFFSSYSTSAHDDGTADRLSKVQFAAD